MRPSIRPRSKLTKAVVFDFSDTRDGENVREFLRLDSAGSGIDDLLPHRWAFSV